jgi:hypothetical protein
MSSHISKIMPGVVAVKPRSQLGGPDRNRAKPLITTTEHSVVQRKQPTITEKRLTNNIKILRNKLLTRYSQISYPTPPTLSDDYDKYLEHFNKYLDIVKIVDSMNNCRDQKVEPKDEIYKNVEAFIERRAAANQRRQERRLAKKNNAPPSPNNEIKDPITTPTMAIIKAMDEVVDKVAELRSQPIQILKLINPQQQQLTSLIDHANGTRRIKTKITSKPLPAITEDPTSIFNLATDKPGTRYCINCGKEWIEGRLTFCCPQPKPYIA